MGIIMCIFHVYLEAVKDNISFSDAIARTVASLAVGIYALVMLFTVGGLAFYHMSLVCRNLTTNEDVSIKILYIPYFLVSRGKFSLKTLRTLPKRTSLNSPTSSSSSVVQNTLDITIFTNWYPQTCS